MLIGVPKEIKNHEYRVGMAPASVREAIKHGHQVMVQSNAGDGIGVGDAEYAQIGAEIIDSADEIFARAELVVKVKEPQATERAMLREGQVLFTYLHLAPDPEQTKDLVASGATCIAYETVTSPHGGLPLLAPMSKVAGRMAIQAGAYCLEHPHGGLGMLLGGVPGVDPAKVVILGAGVVGTHATHIAVGMGADVWVIDRNPEAIEAHWKQFGRSTNTVFSTQDAVERHVLDADLVIGGVLIPRRDGQGNEARRGHRRCRYRPGWLLRNFEADDACRTDLYRRRRCALLRGQYAGRRAAHLDLRAQQRHLAARAGARRQGLPQGADGGPLAARRAQCAQGQDHPARSSP
jgi:alanine dehydrogenase